MPRTADAKKRSPSEDATNSEPSPVEYATIKVMHHAMARDRTESLRRRPSRRSRQVECGIVGHAWIDDTGREHGTICMVCHVVRWP